jgi:hypothetical protein
VLKIVEIKPLMTGNILENLGKTVLISQNIVFLTNDLQGS